VPMKAGRCFGKLTQVVERGDNYSGLGEEFQRRIEKDSAGGKEVSRSAAKVKGSKKKNLVNRKSNYRRHTRKY